MKAFFQIIQCLFLVLSVFKCLLMSFYFPNSFPATGVLAGLVERPVVISLSRAAKYLRPFAAFYMTW